MVARRAKGPKYKYAVAASNSAEMPNNQNFFIYLSRLGSGTVPAQTGTDITDRFFAIPEPPAFLRGAIRPKSLKARLLDTGAAAQLTKKETAYINRPCFVFTKYLHYHRNLSM